ncbi:hypothetical protein [Nocardia sp. alder85J]|uniref:hypothetical protein n=1 Tax=Nocardia sp. alder85J TaxID=2862949 RepID=UPI001CD3AE39|nr:hypothetical protein [Nocardia sp. alder85J]MCX4094556.1 hypothetical protein [Nocardia sp. alder85J]
MNFQDTDHWDRHVTIDLSPAPHTLELRFSGAGLFSIDAPIESEPGTGPDLRTWLRDVLTERFDIIVNHLATDYHRAQNRLDDEPPF